MAQHNKLGKLGEQLAIQWLEKINYRILDVNWRFGRAEIDVIAMTRGILVIVEVKTRSSSGFGRPVDFVNQRKMKMLIDAGTAYAMDVNHDGEIRFDIVGVLVLETGGYRIRHIEDAFFPEIGFDNFL